MDAEHLVQTASLVAAVLARGPEISLVALTGQREVVSQSSALINSGFTLFGFIGVVDGRVVAVPEDGCNREGMFALGQAHRVMAVFAAKAYTGDSQAWLENLHKLEDPRA
jgi:hypothetical protein